MQEIRRQVSLVLIWIWQRLGYPSGGNLLPVAELKQVCNIFEIKALGTDSEEVCRSQWAFLFMFIFSVDIVQVEAHITKHGSNLISLRMDHCFCSQVPSSFENIDSIFQKGNSPVVLGHPS